MVVIGMAALRRMCLLTSWRRGMPRLMAVWTCSRSASSRIADRVTRATMASEDSASANAGSVKWRKLLTKSVPLPSAGNQRSLTANSATSTIAATKDGIAAEMALETSTDVSSRPGRSPLSRPMPMPSTRMISEAYRTSPAVVQIREAISVVTFSRSVIEIPRFPCIALVSQYQY